jgi:ABC-type branched-subunit amino acid transport system ATPase component
MLAEIVKVADPMRLKLKSTFLSIKDFPEIDLPMFTLITGLNGAGKSHILRAIKEGHIVSSVTANHQDEIRLYDWQTMMPQDTGTYDGRTWLQHRSTIRDNVRNYLRQNGNRILDIAKQFGVPTEYLKDASYLSSLSLDDLTRILGDDAKATAARSAIQQEAMRAGNDIRQQIGRNDNLRRALEEIQKRSEKPLTALDDNDFFFDGEDRWGQTDPFQQSLAQAFVAYRDLALKNELKLRAKELGRATDALNHDEFIAKHMIAPWVFVNEAMMTAQLDFAIDHPDLDDYVPYQPRLTKRSTGAHVFFSDLSSGEKILMSLALSLYHANDPRQLTIYPKILLLDEIDAPLHPSMARFYLEILTKTIVGKNRIPVVATTHSASTVALAPEESVFVVELGKPGLRKTTKSQALNLLTQGVPTLAISFEGRRQVFVESHNDAQLYDTLNQTLKPTLASSRSLEFVATGLRGPQNLGHINTGCDVVRHLVDALSKAGNKSVFGLIDWDGKNASRDRVVVLAHGKRNGIENLIFDPLLLAAFIAGHDRQEISLIGIPPHANYPSFLNFSPTELQPIARRRSKN